MLKKCRLYFWWSVVSFHHIAIYWIIHKNVLEFMDIKSNFPQEPEV